MADHVVMILSNPYQPDPRVRREAEALLSAGFDVTLVCWDRRAELPERENVGGLAIRRVQNVVSSYGSGWRQLFYLPRFWRKAQQIAESCRPDIIHCHDLDTLYAGRRLKRRLGCPLVYDAHEHYPALMSLYLPAPMIPLLVWWERWLLRSADLTITASTVLRDEYLAAGVNPVLTLGNYASPELFGSIDPADTRQLRADLGVREEQLLVAYIGGFSRNRLLLPFIEAAGQLPDVAFHLWGGGLQEAEVRAAVLRHPNAFFHGWLSPADLPRYFQVADVIYYGLRTDYPGAIYNAPNTLAQAMAAGKPLIANDVGDLGRIMREVEAGILLDEISSSNIAGAVTQLRDPETRSRIGARAQRAARELHSVGMMQRRLVEAYADFRVAARGP